MSSIPATNDQLLEVRLACEEFRVHWGKFDAMPYQPTFDGVLDDIWALDYLEYEGLGFPSGGDEAATLVWGNVLVRQVGFVWVNSHQGDLLLSWGGPGRYPRGPAIWPYARVREAEVGARPQFDRFAWLTQRVIAGCLTGCDHLELEIRLRQFKVALGMP